LNSSEDNAPMVVPSATEPKKVTRKPPAPRTTEPAVTLVVS
jgi:hypothetical protein